MNEFRGIILYDIQLNGDLNGVYTNNHPDTRAELFTETARLIEAVGDYRTNGRMVYDCFYFDVGGVRVNARLEFVITDGIISAEWIVDNETWFRGEGYQMNQRQIVITYTDEV